MSIAKEFKEFALKGNVVDLAVGVIIGGAFGKIVDSIVGDLIMPLVSRIFGGLDFSNYYIGLAGQAAGLTLVEAKKTGAVFAYGSFLTVAINFVILAFIIFMMVPKWSSQFLVTFDSKSTLRKCLMTSLLALSTIPFSSLEYASVLALCIPHIASSSVTPPFENSDPPSWMTSNGVQN